MDISAVGQEVVSKVKKRIPLQDVKLKVSLVEGRVSVQIIEWSGNFHSDEYIECYQRSGSPYDEGINKLHRKAQQVVNILEEILQDVCKDSNSTVWFHTDVEISKRLSELKSPKYLKWA